MYLDGRPLAVIAPATGTIGYLLDDRLGTPLMATSSTQSVLWQASYDPFGQGTASGGLQQDLRMPGQVFDPNAGWVHNGWRDYMAPWGRYLEMDPLGLGGGLNPLRHLIHLEHHKIIILNVRVVVMHKVDVLPKLKNKSDHG